MTDQPNPVPAEYRGVIPYLVVRGAAEAIQWYQSVFGAEEVLRLASPEDNTIGHAELCVAGGRIMLADEVPDMDIHAPPSVGGTPVGLLIYVEDASAVFHRALEAGATVFKPMCEQFYGDRSGTIEDPFGHRWTISSRIEDVDNAEILRRFQQLIGGE